MISQYAKRVTEIYNHHAELYAKARETGDMVEESVHALVCNAINLQVAKSTHRELKGYFRDHAIVD